MTALPVLPLFRNSSIGFSTSGKSTDNTDLESGVSFALLSGHLAQNVGVKVGVEMENGVAVDKEGCTRGVAVTVALITFSFMAIVGLRVETAFGTNLSCEEIHPTSNTTMNAKSTSFFTSTFYCYDMPTAQRPALPAGGRDETTPF